MSRSGVTVTNGASGASRLGHPAHSQNSDNTNNTNNSYGLWQVVSLKHSVQKMTAMILQTTGQIVDVEEDARVCAVLYKWLERLLVHLAQVVGRLQELQASSGGDDRCPAPPRRVVSKLPDLLQDVVATPGKLPEHHPDVLMASHLSAKDISHNTSLDYLPDPHRRSSPKIHRRPQRSRQAYASRSDMGAESRSSEIARVQERWTTPRTSTDLVGGSDAVSVSTFLTEQAPSTTARKPFRLSSTCVTSRSHTLPTSLNSYQAISNPTAALRTTDTFDPYPLTSREAVSRRGGNSVLTTRISNGLDFIDGDGQAPEHTAVENGQSSTAAEMASGEVDLDQLTNDLDNEFTKDLVQTLRAIGDNLDSRMSRQEKNSTLRSFMSATNVKAADLLAMALPGQSIVKVAMDTTVSLVEIYRQL